MSQNIVSLNLTADQLAAVDAALTELETQLSGLIALPPAQKRGLRKMGERSEAFCRQALHVLEQNPQLVPANVLAADAIGDLAAIDTLRPRMMGGWFLGTSYSEVLAAALGKLSSMEISEGEVLNVADALAKYDALFVFSAKIGIGSGLLTLLLTPLIKRWMHGVK